MRHSPEFHRSIARRSRRRRRRRGGPNVVVVLLLALAGGALFGAGWGSVEAVRPADAARPETARVAEGEGIAGVRFGLCHSGGGSDCVIDGDTFRLAGERIRIADIDAPETHPPRCAEEARLGEAATLRLRSMLNRGDLRLVVEGRESDRYGRKLRVVLQGGRSVGAQLVAEGLARPWEGRRRPWC